MMRDFTMRGGVKQRLLVPVEVVPRSDVKSHEGVKRLRMLYKWVKSGHRHPVDVSDEDWALLMKYYGVGEKPDYKGGVR